MNETTHRTHHRGPIDVGDAEIWVEQRGEGPDVLLVAGLSDPLESWSYQLEGLADRYRLTAFDNRGAGRSPLPPEDFTVAHLADDAAAVLQGLGIDRAHVLGFSGGAAIAQELALRHPASVRSLVLNSTWARTDAYFDAMVDAWTWLGDGAPSERAMLEAFYLWIYTPRAHESGWVSAVIDDVLAFEHAQTPEGFHRQLAAFRTHDTFDRLPDIRVPTLVVSGEIDLAAPPRHGRVVADRIPGAELVVLPGEAHQPFQESPVAFNELVADFWSRIDEDGRR